MWDLIMILIIQDDQQIAHQQPHAPSNIGEDLELVEDDDNWENSEPTIHLAVGILI